MIRVLGRPVALLMLAFGPWACDCGGTPAGVGDAGSGERDATSTNQAPTVSAREAIALLPGDSAELLLEEVSDADGDALTCTWQAEPELAGVVLPTGCDSPVLAVDRTLYEAGPAAQDVALTLTVSDGLDTAERAIAVTILDERGGDVANTSTWEGQGYQETGARHGFCGAPGRACSNIEDAMANLRGRIAGGDEVEPLIRMATTGTTYLRDTALLLDDDAAASGVVLSLECGFDPESWDKASDTWQHTPIRFSSAEGVRITASGVRLEGCSIQADEPAQTETARTAVHVVDAAAEIRDNSLSGAPQSLQAIPETAVGLHIELTDPDTELGSLVADNTIQGGVSSVMTIGLLITGGVPQVQGNSIIGGSSVSVIGAMISAREGGAVRAEVAWNPLIEGGSADNFAYGLWVRAGDVWVHDNEDIVGCAISCDGGGYVGLLVGEDQASFSTPLLERNRVRGVIGQHTPGHAAGLAIVGSAVSRDNFYGGGRAGVALGGQLRGGLHSFGDHFEGGTGLDLDAASHSDGFAVGLELYGEEVVLDGSTVLGASTASPSTLQTIGVRCNEVTTFRVTAGSVASGPASELAVGVLLQGAGARLDLDGTTVEGGDTAGAAGSVSTGIIQYSGRLTWTDAVVRAGQAETSTGLQHDGDGSYFLQGGQVAGGDCSAPEGVSRGVWLQGLSTISSLDGLEVRGGDGCQFSYGLHAEDSTGMLRLRDSLVAGGEASLMSAAAYFGVGCEVCRIERNTLVAGGSEAATTALAVGLHLRAVETEPQLDRSSFVVANRIRGGSATVSQGLWVAGNAGDDLVFLHNSISGAGLASGLSAAVFLAGDADVGSAHAGVFVGNLIDAGVGATSYGYFEGCSMSGGLHRAEPYFSFNNAFWPAIDGQGDDPTAYVRKAPATDCSAMSDMTTIVQVNGLAYYGSSSSNRASLDVDPLFEADGYHLQPGSPLKEASRMTPGFWPFALATTPEDMLDVDSVARPCGDEYDIGVHELCP